MPRRVLVMGLLAAACGGGTDPNPPPDPSIPKAIKIVADRSALFYGATLRLRAIVTNARGDTLTAIPIWSSTNPTAIPVGADGTVTGLGLSSAQITARVNTLESTITLSVVRLTQFTYTPGLTTMTPDEVDTLRVTGYDGLGTAYFDLPIDYRSDHRELLTVTADGILTAQESDGGLADIYLRVGYLTGKILLSVTAAPVATVQLSPPATPLWGGEVVHLAYSVASANGTTLSHRTLRWSASDTSVASVAYDGTVSSHRAGKVDVGLEVEGKSANLSLEFQRLPPFSVALSQRCALATTGQVYCWSADVPVAEPVGPALLSLTGVNHFCGLTAAGSAYCWRSNASGQVGDGTTDPRPAPTPVSGGLVFSQLSAGGDYTCGVAISGAAYCWGSNQSGQLGTGDSTARLTPTAVVGGLTFSSITASPNDWTTCGITTSRQAYCWGNNQGGQGGTGDSASSVAPRPVSGGLLFRSITTSGYHTCGVATDGTGYCWGTNVYGGLGDGSVVSTATPHAVSGGPFSLISAGYLFTCGVASTGAAQCWGWNEANQVGDGTGVQRQAPVTISAGAFTQVESGHGTSCGTTTSGLVYCWGGTYATPTLMSAQN